MANEERPDLDERLAKLEKRVSQLEEALNEASMDPEKSEVLEAGDSGTSDSYDEPWDWDEDTGRQRALDLSDLTLGESWLSRIGIVLLLLGVVFLFKYSIDQGWVIPPVRSFFGLMIGLALFTGGLQLEEESKPIRQILLGGGIAAFYITGFATFQLYDFASYAVVWSFMIVVTLLGLSFSLQQDEALLSVTALLGGLGTPFMLYSGSGSLTALVLYTALVLTAGGLIYYRKGWRSVLWSTVVGGWLVFLVALINGISIPDEVVQADRWALQLGILYGMGLFWFLPVTRELNRHRSHTDDIETRDGKTFRAESHILVLIVIVPVVTFFLSNGLWDARLEWWGGIALIGALLTGYGYLPLRSRGMQSLSMAHGYAALMLMTVGLVLLLEGDILIITLIMEAVGIRVIARRTDDDLLSAASHFLSFLVWIWLLDRLLFVGTQAGHLISLPALTELFVIGVTGIAVPIYLRKRTVKLVYRVLAHLFMLGWLLNELSVLDNGQAWVTVAWGGYAVILLLISFRSDIKRLRVIGMGTILLVVGKLFLIDLSQIDTLLRILLFIGFGAVLLALSYLFQRTLQSQSDKTMNGDDTFEG